MSKNALRKELLTFTGEQLVEVILNAYSASKETKEYFDFFLNPDTNKLFDKKIEIIAKEIARSKRGYSRARISNIKATIRKFESFGVEAELLGKLIFSTIRMLLAQSRYARFTDTLLNGTLKLVSDYITLADNHGFASEAIQNIKTISDSALGTPSFRNRIYCHAASITTRRPK